ncbi:MAG: ATP-dependent DNA helicase RecQ [Chlamydiae bacterium]|nr:ATP-dependent DNA helicase RecQ [Chlamydiota bacterium]
MNLEEQLKKHFGYNEFRAHQKDIISQLLEGKDVLAILPTGAGKSLCYQLPAMIIEGTAVVVSPLISLMQDQVVSLNKNGIEAGFINSSLSPQGMHQILSHLNTYRIIFVAPERLADESFLERLKSTKISFFAIDEAHCISQWGHSFRPEYRKLSLLKERFPKNPVIALTATATLQVQGDILKQLTIPDAWVLKGSFDRPNLTIRMTTKTNSERQILDFLEKHPNESGIIYAGTRKGVDETFLSLQSRGYQVGRYHAGMSDNDRSTFQQNFVHDKLQLMVATVAFGMGIHKPDIRFIIHLDMPKSIEQYYQEIGRAGRDGLPSECLLLHSGKDIILNKFFADKIEDEFERKMAHKRVQLIYNLCTSYTCRRRGLLGYFGEIYNKSSCDSCDNCLNDGEKIDGTEITQKILSCVYRLQQRFGIKHVVDVLRGTNNANVLKRQHDKLSTYGILSQNTEREVRSYIDQLLSMGYLERSEGDYPILKWTEKSQQAISGNETIQFRKGHEKVSYQQRRFRQPESLFEKLRLLRLEIAREENVPPYAIFSDRTLLELAEQEPIHDEDFMLINGVGPVKLDKYGERFLDLIINNTPKPKVKTHHITKKMIQEGLAIDEIAKRRQMTPGTIINHFLILATEGFSLNIDRYVEKDKQELIVKALKKVGSEKLSPVKEVLPDEVTYDEIRLVRAVVDAN